MNKTKICMIVMLTQMSYGIGAIAPKAYAAAGMEMDPYEDETEYRNLVLSIAKRIASLEEEIITVTKDMKDYRDAVNEAPPKDRKILDERAAAFDRDCNEIISDIREEIKLAERDLNEINYFKRQAGTVII